MATNNVFRPAGDAGPGAVHLRRRRNRETTMELADAAAVRTAPDHLLASGWAPGVMPHPLRRLSPQRLRVAFQFPAAHGGALGEDDPRRARTLPPELAWTLRLFRASP